MGKYASVITVPVDFDGDPVNATLSRISFADALAMQGATPAEASQIVAKYVQRLDGLFDAAGAPVALETVFSQFYFAPLVAELTKAVLGTGSMPEGGVRPFGER